MCSLKKHTSSTKNIPIVLKKKLNKPLAGFPPSLRLKEPQTKHTSLILTERLQYKKSLGRIFGAAKPPGALVKGSSCSKHVVTRSYQRPKSVGFDTEVLKNKNPAKDFCWWDLGGVVVVVVVVVCAVVDGSLDLLARSTCFFI